VTSAAETLPISETLQSSTQEQLAATIADAFASDTPIYPFGGGTSLSYGLKAKSDGIGLSVAGLNRVVDYPASDMTITVEAGITMDTLVGLLAENGQRLPIDVPDGDRATLGGVMATNWNGPRRYGMGTVRDYVIGVQAVDGRGIPFRGGGRVVKNVAGYDFCKMLTGSLGTLGVITELTVRVVPIPQQSLLLAAAVESLSQAEELLAGLVKSETRPTAIELLGGPAWQQDSSLSGVFSSAPSPAPAVLLVGFEGTTLEVEWMRQKLASEWSASSVKPLVATDQTAELWDRLGQFSASGDSPLVIKANMVPSATTRFIEQLLQIDPDCNFQAHAGSGIVIAQFSAIPDVGVTKAIVGRLLPLAAAAYGNVEILCNTDHVEETRQAVWGGIDAPFALMNEIKKQFDPKNLLNPGRFVYS